MTEGNTYLCDWSRIKGVYRVWLDDRPSVFEEDVSFFECEILFCERILSDYGDGEPLLYYKNGQPIDSFPSKYARPYFHELFTNYQSRIINRYGDLYTKDKCQACNSPRGNRAEEQLIFKSFPKDQDIICAYNVDSLIVSKRIMDLFSLGDLFKVKEVLSKDATRRKFYEILPPEGSRKLEYVAVKESKNCLGRQDAFKCNNACGSSIVGYFTGLTIHHLFRKSELVEHSRGIYLANTHLVLNHKLLKQLRGKIKKIKKVSIVQVGTAQDEDIDKNPTYQSPIVNGLSTEV